MARREEAEIQDRMTPALWEDAAGAMAPLFGLPMRDGTDDDMLLAAYQITIAGEPLWAIKETVIAFVSGRAGNGFCPNSAVFGKELRERTSAERSKWARIRKQREEAERLAAEEAVARQPISDEARRQIEEIQARIAARSAEVSKPAPITTPYRQSGALARVMAETAAKRAARQSNQKEQP